MGFLDIPVEVREQILNEYLDGHTGEIPVNPTSSIDGREIKATGHIFYKKIQNPALPVLLVSKQLQAEMEGVLNRKRSQKANYALDIMERKASYRQWKLDTAEKRQRAGFRVVEEDKTRRWWE
ncbi:hypothetical protein UCRPA7_1417 [Phaeoacremonium minimum UCRPA7]|uniref:Uncharacterized protein n=1 Tax=Phaeoacremonium minimum (strain UCR-PA7) TaxID=1286976 RepID=R8BUM0_PHAM7|nr:hypothetical protein UCRPA7_1417 [Phaeoacremonium minimum UCRPA7]EOO03071.1 hypothetical protein UCRPA7_1417 [Phaeoacremonium minimum UCRPA7]